GIAHDLKNLLNPLNMRLQLLDRQLQRDAREAAQSNIAEMRQIVHTGVQTLERLQAFSRQAPQARAEPVDLNAICPNALEIRRPRMAQNRSTPCYLVEEFGAPPAVSGSSSELVNAIVNLVCNAIDAMPDGGTITVRTGADPSGAFIEVRDDGPGMSKEVEQR